MRLHTLSGMKAEVILAFADICIHEEYMQMVWFYTLRGKCYTTYCGRLRKCDGIGYFGTIEFYIYKYF